jgi:hypothetical protein
MSVQKRLRERKKAEKAELKRETRKQSGNAEREPGDQVAGRDDLEGYGVAVPPSGDPEEA